MNSPTPHTLEQIERAKRAWSKRASDAKFLMVLFVLPWPLWFVPATAEYLRSSGVQPISMALFAAYEAAIILLVRRKSVCPACGAQLGDWRIRLKFCPQCAIPLE